MNQNSDEKNLRDSMTNLIGKDIGKASLKGGRNKNGKVDEMNRENSKRSSVFKRTSLPKGSPSKLMQVSIAIIGPG